MALGILGKKVGMTQIFDTEGRAVPVTVIQAGPCWVTQLKTKATDGYTAVQLGFDPVPPKRLNKPEQGHVRKAGLEVMVRHLREYRLPDPQSYQLGQEITVSLFQPGQRVDISGTSIGRGFAGYQKRHHFGRGPMSHGSKNHREPGSVGAGTTPGRVFPGLRGAGRLGGKRATIRHLEIVKVIPEHNLLLVKGGIPGVEGGLVEIRPAKRVQGQAAG
ncbi:MAG: 50S ribosomal protein L3 [Thermostichales cyanobacterium BF4_bins_65]